MFSLVCCKLQRISRLHHCQLRCQVCASAYSECDWLQCVHSECCWLASFLLALCYRSSVIAHLSSWQLASVPAAVEDGLLRLCEAENSVLPPLGEELRPDHPLLGSRRVRNAENESSSSTTLPRYIVLGKCTSSFHLLCGQICSH